ncbi:hypothetical protein F4778DRAFT_772644 [Xylariomycetidae sp. FL2044]|nr:hypothetical protein F4778DRAFT_772644 [Xylariomycetidae sp. FL2044]
MTGLSLTAWGDTDDDGARVARRALNDKKRQRLKQIINAIQIHGDFATRSRYSEFANPGLQIGDTLIALPLDPAQVSVIRRASRQAPFGRRDQTLVDTSVRNTWELDPTQFRITNPAFAPFLARVLDDVSRSLGMISVKTELYKLLLYEKDSFFKRHKDSEKPPGMTGTLSICLPSRHKGGEVHLSHAGRSQVIDTSQTYFDISALAWFSDVTHEIKPVLDGHRLVLIYNIIQTDPRNGPNSAKSIVEHHQKLEHALGQFLSSKNPRRCLRLDHLKGRDRAVCESLRQICVTKDCFLFFCNITKQSTDAEWSVFDESDSSDNGHDSSGCYRYRYIHSRFDGDDAPKLAMDTIATSDGRIFASEVNLNRADMLNADVYDTREVDSESEGEYMGYEGPGTKYRYHDSAAVIVPKNRLEQFFKFNVEMKVLYDLVVADYTARPKDTPTHERMTSFLAKILKKEPKFSPIIIQAAWKFYDQGLFDNAIRAGFMNGVPRDGVIDAVMITAKMPQRGRVEWDKSLGEFVSSHQSLTRLSQSMEYIRKQLGPGKLQKSFQQWQSTMQLRKFENKQDLGADDHDSLLELLSKRWGDAKWVKKMFVPKLRDKSDKQLLSKVICSLLQKDREGVLANAKELVTVLLGTEKIQFLQLAGVKFNSLARDESDCEESHRFLQLLDDFQLSGLQGYVDELLRIGVHTIKRARKTPDPHLVVTSTRGIHIPYVAEMLGVMCRDFEKNDMPTSEAAREFVIAGIRKFILTDLPVCPVKPEGHAHSERGCGKCMHCEELDEFLISPTEKEREFQKGPMICSHLESRLPSHLFRRNTRELVAGRSSHPNRKSRTEAAFFTTKPPVCMLKVVKLDLEYGISMDKYKDDVRNVVETVKRFRTDYMKRLLGDGPYGELIMLNKLPHAHEIQPRQAARRPPGKRSAMHYADDDSDDSGFPEPKRWKPDSSI